MFVINSPFIFRTVWAFVNTMLDERQRAKINILGGPDSYLPKLLKEVDISDLPAALGGDDSSADFRNERGPWAAHMPVQAAPATVPGPLSLPSGLPPAMQKAKWEKA